MRDRAGALIASLALVVPFVALGGQLASGCVFDAANDCAQNLGYGEACSEVGKGGSGGAGSATGMGAGSTTSATGGGAAGGNGGTGGMGGTGGGCSSPADCPPPTMELCPRVATCVNEVCGVAFVAGPAAVQKYGDCHEWQCDDAGNVTKEEKTDDVYDDGNECTTDKCIYDAGQMKQVAVNEPKIGVACATGTCGFAYPLSDPICLECDATNPGSCGGGGVVCSSTGKCVPSSCDDGIKVAPESAIDCGGPLCAKCTDNSPCNAAADCVSGVCMGNPKKCQVPSCFDGVLNGDEPVLDCGSSQCMGCKTDDACRHPIDCESGVCINKKCQAATCTDGTMNGDETGIDCGGTGNCTACLPP